MKDIIILAVLVAGYSAAVFYAGYTNGAASIVSKSQTETIKELKNEAQSFADRPRTRNDRIDRLCEWTATKLKDEGKSLKRLPYICNERNQ